jgi:hypothetical protein
MGLASCLVLDGWGLREDAAPCAGGTPDEEHFDAKVSGLDAVDTVGRWVNKVRRSVGYMDILGQHRRL